MSIEGVQLAAIVGIQGLVRIGFVPEARLHVFEFVEAWEEGHVELGGISGFLENSWFNSIRRKILE